MSQAPNMKQPPASTRRRRARAPAARRARPADGHLSRDLVADAALELLDAEGLDRFSMRRLAAHLGVGAMTLYHYFPSRRELLDAVVDTATAAAMPRALRGSWRARIVALVQAARKMLEAHPSLAEIRARQPMLSPGGLRTNELALEVLEDAGFTRDEAVKAYRLLFTYAFGFSVFSPASTADAAREAARRATRALPANLYPRLTAAIDEDAEAMAGEEVFEWGLARILDGLEARLGRRASPMHKRGA